MPLDQFDVTLRPDEPVRLLNNYREEREVSRWSMQAIAAPEGYAGALVVEGHGWQLKSFSLEKSMAQSQTSKLANEIRPEPARLSL